MHTSRLNLPTGTARRALLGTAGIVSGALMLATGVGAVAHADTPSAIAAGSADIAYQGSDHNLYTVTPDGTVHPTGLGLAPGTSPSITQQPDQTYWTAAQVNTGALWLVDQTLRGWPQNVDVQSGTSPATAYDQFDGSIQTWFQSAPGQLGHLSGTGGKDLLAGSNTPIEPNTGPAVSDGSTAVDVGNGITSPNSAVTGAMAPNTNPSISFAPNVNRADDHTAFAWQGADKNVHYTLMTGAGGALEVFQPGLGMMPGTSPSIAVQPGGGYEVVFQSNAGELWTIDSTGTGHDTHLGMDQKTSPGVTALSSGGYEIAFQANTNTLWTVNGTTLVGAPVPNAAMDPASSPSISAFNAGSQSLPAGDGPSPAPGSSGLQPQRAKGVSFTNCDSASSYGIYYQDMTAGTARTEFGTLHPLTPGQSCATGAASLGLIAPNVLLPGHVYTIRAQKFGSPQNGCNADLSNPPSQCITSTITVAGSDGTTGAAENLVLTKP